MLSLIGSLDCEHKLGAIIDLSNKFNNPLQFYYYNGVLILLLYTHAVF